MIESTPYILLSLIVITIELYMVERWLGREINK